MYLSGLRGRDGCKCENFIIKTIPTKKAHNQKKRQKYDSQILKTRTGKVTGIIITLTKNHCSYSNIRSNSHKEKGPIKKQFKYKCKCK